MITLATRMGTFKVAESDVLSFAGGVPGFEAARRFVMITTPSLDPLRCLQSVDGDGVSFLTIDPRLVKADFSYPLLDDERHRLGDPSDESLVWLAMLVLGPEGVTANLAAPIVINAAGMCGMQLVRADSPYPLDYPVRLDAAGD